MRHVYEMPRLRMYRRSAALTLRDLALLLGFKSGAHVSRLEHGKRTPSLETALACVAIFGVPLDEIFPDLLARMSDRVRARATRFRLGQKKPSTPGDWRKLALVDEIVDRLAHEPRTIEA